MPIQLILFVTIRDANIKTARTNIEEALQVTSEIFFSSLSQRRDSLLSKVRALSSDYAFKPAAHTNEHQTVLSTLLSYQSRVNADVMLLLNMDGQIIADTLHPKTTATEFYLPHLVELAMDSEYGEADIIDFIDNKPYILVAVPLFSPEPSHWIIMGFLINDEFSKKLQQTTKSQVSILYGALNENWRQLSTTLDDNNKRLSESALLAQPWAFESSFDLVLKESSYVSIILPIRKSSNHFYIALLQRSLDHALAPYQKLHLIVASVFCIALLILILGGFFIARQISKPVTILTNGAQKIEQGHYDLDIKVPQKDELGQLANQFNSMAKGLAERAKVRSLLGKVVSSAIAEQLINKGVELGGEERQTTILFSDIRNFTSMCESHTPKEVILLLNQLLTRLTASIDNNHGVVDKYIGDAVMALFGVPVADNNQANNAVLAALMMQQELTVINEELSGNNFPEIGLGIGINTDKVLAGNMGSNTRLNYTVIGDGVNLSSRLEGLTKFYGISILVSETTQSQCDGIIFREIDTVRVKGKTQGITVYQPLGTRSEIDESKLDQIKLFHDMLVNYQQQQWEMALSILNTLDNIQGEHLYSVYIQRIDKLKKLNIDKNWDGIYTHEQK